MKSTLKCLVNVQAGHPFRGSVPPVAGGNAFALQMRDLNPNGEVTWESLVQTQIDAPKTVQWLEPGDVEDPALDIDLRAFQAAGLRHPQAVAEQEQQQAAVTGRVPRALDRFQEPVHLARGQVFALIHRFVSSSGWVTRRNSRACGDSPARL